MSRGPLFGEAPSATEGEQLSFTGEFHHAIDAKGRLIVPARMRDELVEDKVVLTRYTEGCIAMWSGVEWERFEQGLVAQSKGDPNARAVVRAFAASAHQDTIDRQGRISVPPQLRALASLDRDVVISGAFDHGEIWSPETWEQEQAKAEPGRLEELFERLPNL